MTLKTERRKRSGNSGGSREPFHPENEREVVLFHPLSPWYSRIDNLEDEASRILSRGILSSTPFTDSYPSYGEISSFSTNPTKRQLHILASGNRFLSSSFSFHFSFLALRDFPDAHAEFPPFVFRALGNNETCIDDSMIIIGQVIRGNFSICSFR